MRSGLRESSVTAQKLQRRLAGSYAPLRGGGIPAGGGLCLKGCQRGPIRSARSTLVAQTDLALRDSLLRLPGETGITGERLAVGIPGLAVPARALQIASASERATTSGASRNRRGTRRNGDTGHRRSTNRDVDISRIRSGLPAAGRQRIAARRGADRDPPSRSEAVPIRALGRAKHAGTRLSILGRRNRDYGWQGPRGDPRIRVENPAPVKADRAR